MKKALIIVDMLNDFIRDDGKLPIKNTDYVIENIGKIKGAYEENNILVIYANDSHDKDDPEFKDWPEHCVKGTYGAEIIDELAKSSENVIIEKKTFSGFSNRKMDIALQLNNVKEVYVTGVATDYCVKHTALEAQKYGYETYLVTDAIQGAEVNKGDTNNALIKMGNAGIKSIKTNEVLENIVKYAA